MPGGNKTHQSPGDTTVSVPGGGAAVKQFAEHRGGFNCVTPVNSVGGKRGNDGDRIHIPLWDYV